VKKLTRKLVTVSAAGISAAALALVLGLGTPSEARADEEDAQRADNRISGTPTAISPQRSSLAVYDIFQRPDPEGVPTKVWVGIYMMDVSDISDVDRYVAVDMIINLKWRDPRLADSPKKAGQTFRRFKLEEVWTPDVIMLNSNQLSKRQKDVVIVDAEGTVSYTQRVAGEVSFNIDLEEFPFDKHEVSIGLVARGYSTNEVAFQPDSSRTGRESRFTIVDFDVGPVTTRVGTYHYAPADKTISAFFFEFHVERHSAFYVWKVLLPLVLIVLMSWTVFLIDPNQIGPQIGISTASVFTLIIFQFNLARLVPRVPYLMVVDYFSLGAIVLVFMALIEAVLSVSLVRWGREEIALKMDRLSRLVFPAIFVAYLAVVLLTLE